MRSLLGWSLLALSFFIGGAVADLHAHRRHHDAGAIARRSKTELTLHKRFDGARFTFYDVGLGACGKTNVPSDFIVALNTPQYGGGSPGPQCFKSITITYGGKSTQATIMDECPGCPWGGLDMSRGLFDYFASESMGVLYGSWWFDGSAPAASNPPPSTTWKPPPSSTWTPPPSPTWSSTSSSWSPPPAPTTSSDTSSWSQPFSSSSQSSSSSSRSSSSASSSSHKSSSVASPSASPSSVSQNPNNPQIISSFNQVLLGVGSVIVAAQT